MGGESPITFLSLDAYARRYGIAGVEFEHFLALVGAMDEEYLEHIARIMKAEKERAAEEARMKTREAAP
ncbi:hypothetical protein [Bradyrhizobium sp. Ai1a-2]|uniref:hypothetical protein n=1 Tax=Bradyrhizobium sp. Ai1a-2 TaxID=196490 RepID=UPI0003F6C25A|nr:hypothetical protein [Bradyrhizobium sp. Ai1a-2]